MPYYTGQLHRQFPVRRTLYSWDEEASAMICKLNYVAEFAAGLCTGFPMGVTGR